VDRLAKMSCKPQLGATWLTHSIIAAAQERNTRRDYATVHCICFEGEANKAASALGPRRQSLPGFLNWRARSRNGSMSSVTTDSSMSSTTTSSWGKLRSALHISQGLGRGKAVPGPVEATGMVLDLDSKLMHGALPGRRRSLSGPAYHSG